MEQHIDFQTGQNKKEKEGTWAKFANWDKPLLVFIFISLFSAFIALFVLLTPLLDLLLGFMGLHYAGWNQWNSWIMDADRGLFIVAALALTALVFALLARYRFRRDWSVYAEAGCPQCHEHELIRVRRNPRDRSLSFLGVPVRRYSCRNCTWHGVRLTGYRYARPADKIDEIDAGVSESEAGLLVEAVDAVELSTAPALDAEIKLADDDANEAEGLAIEEPEEVGTFESHAEPLSEAEFTTAKLAAQALPAVSTKGMDVSAEDPSVTDSIEFAEPPFESDEPTLVGNNDDEDEVASLWIVDERDENGELDDETDGEEAKADLLDSLIVREPAVEVEAVEDQSGTHEKVVNSVVDSEVDAEDDEFARLCLEVAQSKE